MQLLQESAGASVLVDSQLKEKQKMFAFFFFADVIKYSDILLIALKLQQFFSPLFVAMIDYAKRSLCVWIYNEYLKATECIIF